MPGLGIRENSFVERDVKAGENGLGWCGVNNPGNVQKMGECGTQGNGSGLNLVVVRGWWLDLAILDGYSHCYVFYYFILALFYRLGSSQPILAAEPS